MHTQTRSGASCGPAGGIWLILVGLIALSACDGLASPVDREGDVQAGRIISLLHWPVALEPHGSAPGTLDLPGPVADLEDPDPDSLEDDPRGRGSPGNHAKVAPPCGLQALSVLDILVRAPKQGPPHLSSC